MDGPTPAAAPGRLPTDLPEAVTAQIEQTRSRLRADAVAAGISTVAVDEAIAAAMDAYAGVRVHAYLGILVERQVRESLGLRSAGRAVAPEQARDARPRAATR
jgi:hypothetical protein